MKASPSDIAEALRTGRLGTATVTDRTPKAEPMIGRWVLTIPGYQPVTLNSLMGCNPYTIHRKKQADKKKIAGEAVLAGIPKAWCRRAVALTIILGPRQRAADPDAFWKATLDSLVSCGLLVDDSRQWVRLGAVDFERGERGTIIALEDIP